MDSCAHNEVTAGFQVQPSWVPNATPNPRSWQNPAEWKQRQAALQKAAAAEPPIGHALHANVAAFNEKYDAPWCVREAKRQCPAQPRGTWPGWYSSSDMIAIALGAPEPRWMDGYWWGQWENAPLRQINSPADVAKIPVPDWNSLAVVQNMLASRKRWHGECPEEPPSRLADILEIWAPGQGPIPAICYPSFVDLGIYLMGMTDFLALLGSDPETADALMDLCFDLSTGYVDFLLREQPEHFGGLVGFGGDDTCMLSPALYDRYGAAWDERLWNYVRDRHGLPDDAPCNLHSCGPSAHLYQRWAAHPCRRNITMMQTRLIPGQVAKLRASLPNTVLQLTLHPPHFDVVSAPPDELRQMLWNSVLDAGQGNVNFYIVAVVHRTADLGKVQRSLQVCQAVIAQIRQQVKSHEE